MQPASKNAIRIVVQHTKGYNGWSFRLIAYEDSRSYVPLDFAAMSDLMRAIRYAVPDFAERDLAIKENADHSYIAFSAEWQLSDGQLFLLGLNPASGSWQ